MSSTVPPSLDPETSSNSKSLRNIPSAFPKSKISESLRVSESKSSAFIFTKSDSVISSALMLLILEMTSSLNCSSVVKTISVNVATSIAIGLPEVPKLISPF